jgi:NAD(P)-dependent dehydrogenase (short-subunit alcohol dehydrogenase family)
MGRRGSQVSGRVVAITGGARGIGRATAALLAEAGARVAIGDVDAAAAERTARELGAGVRGFALDVTDRGAFSRFLAAVEQAFGPPDVLVNNAGVMRVGSFLEEPEAATRRQLEVNLGGVLLGMQLVLPGMLARGRGHVVNVASSAGKAGVPGIATYAASKHAVVGLTEAVRMEHRGAGVELSVVLPAVVNTELAAGAGRTPGVRLLEPVDVARAILGLLERPRFEVYVPRHAGLFARLGAALPYPLRERLARLVGVDRVMMGADLSRRTAYEARLLGGAEPPEQESPAVSSKE